MAEQTKIEKRGRLISVEEAGVLSHQLEVMLDKLRFAMQLKETRFSSKDQIINVISTLLRLVEKYGEHVRKLDV